MGKRCKIKAVISAFVVSAVFMGTIMQCMAAGEADAADNQTQNVVEESQTESIIQDDAQNAEDISLESGIDEDISLAADEENIDEPVFEIEPSYNTATTLDITINMIDHPLVQDSFAKLELYSEDGTLLDTQREWVGGITDRIDLHFTVAPYYLGQKFKVKLVEGLNSLQYYDTIYYPGNEFYIETYEYTDENGVHVCGNSFVMTGDPLFKKDVVVYNQYGMMSLSPKARLIDGVTYVPVRQVAESLGLKVRYDGKYNSVAVNIGNREVAYNIGSDITNFFGKDEYMQGKTVSLDGFVFVPVRSLAESFETGIEVKDFGDHLDVIIGESKTVNDYYDSFYVNRMGIGSKTNYLIWVSKSEYKVRAYKGQQYKWEQIAEFPCAIGAPSTPTITGQFDYISRETAWNYDGYYVGPIMRFYNGYALHSTLLYYGGGEYDGRVGVQISHGCVRLHPGDINWLVDNIPLYSRIWVTE